MLSTPQPLLVVGSEELAAEIRELLGGRQNDDSILVDLGVVIQYWQDMGSIIPAPLGTARRLLALATEDGLPLLVRFLDQSVIL